MTRFKRSAPWAASGIAVLMLAGCDESGDFDVTKQIGPNPVLPEPKASLVPDLKVAEVVGWQDGELPDVAEGFKATAYAKDLVNPRTVHTLPNGDVVVVQSRAPKDKPLPRPKDIIRGWIMSYAQGGGSDKPSNLITLLRDSNRDGQVDERHDLLTGLNSPFGVAWHENNLYVAAADAVLVYQYELGQTSISGEPRVLTPLPGGPINHHWTKDLALSADGRFLYASVGSNSNAGERGLEAEKGSLCPYCEPHEGTLYGEDEKPDKAHPLGQAGEHPARSEPVQPGLDGVLSAGYHAECLPATGRMDPT